MLRAVLSELWDIPGATGIAMIYELDDGCGHSAKLFAHIIDHTLFVDDFVGPGPGSLGLSNIRALVRQIRQQFPQIQYLRGVRLTGCRKFAGAGFAKCRP
jgi:hypothetical protein